MRTVKLDDQTYKLPPCPKCGGSSMLIVWGYPTHSAERLVRRGLAIHGGCMPPQQAPPWPTHTCRDCDHDFILEAADAE